MAIQTYAGITTEHQTFYDLSMLEAAKPNLCHFALGQQARSFSIPLNKGMTVDFRKMASLAVATTPLTEGQNPPGKDVTITNLTATVAEYGDFVRYSSLINKTSIDKVVAEISRKLGDQAGLTLDTLTRDAMVAGYTAQYAGSAMSRGTVASTDLLTAAELLEAVTTLRVNNARPFKGNKWACIMHPYTQYDLLQDSLFMNSALFAKDPGQDNPLATALWASWLGIDFYVTSNAKVYTGEGNSCNVYPTMIFGKDAFGVGGLAGDMASSVPSSQSDPNTGKEVRPLQLLAYEPGKPSASDPLGRTGSLGWRTTFVAKVLDASWLIGIEHATTLG